MTGRHGSKWQAWGRSRQLETDTPNHKGEAERADWKWDGQDYELSKRCTSSSKL